MTSSNYSLSADELHLPSSSDLIDPISSIDSSATLFQFNTDPKHIVDEDYYELESIFATNVDIACTFEQKTPLGMKIRKIKLFTNYLSCCTNIF